MFKGFFTLLRRFIPPYKRYIVLNVIFNVLSAFLALFTVHENQVHYTLKKVKIYENRKVMCKFAF